MLLDESYEIKFYANRQRKIYYGTCLEDLRKRPIFPKDWNYRKLKEFDLAVRITHSDIKSYCERIRANEITTYCQKLYDAFIKNDCKQVFYEKVDYIRDRTLYRPSHVVSMTDQPIQTSKFAREQIDSLPNSKELYIVTKSIKDELFTREEELLIKAFETAFLCNYRKVDCPSDYAAQLDYTWEELKQFGGDEQNTSVPTFVAQAMELFSPQELEKYYKKYWEVLLKQN